MTEINRMIQEFLKDTRHSDGGWAPVEPQDMEQLYAITQSLIVAKWGADADGDRPVEHALVDRTRYEGNHYFDLPYWHKAQSEQECMEILRTYVLNAQIANDRLAWALKTLAYGKES